MDGIEERGKPMGCLIILEGADASGKTTLAEAIAERVMEVEGGDVLYLHGKPWPGRVLMEHTRMIGHAGIAGRDTVVIMDHFWIAEQLYGEEYRGGGAYPPADMDDLASDKLKGLIVLCVPMDLDAQIARHAKRRGEGKEHFETATGIVRRYADLWHGNKDKQGTGYLDAAIRGGNFKDRPDVWRFDMNVMPAKTAATYVLQRARQRRWVAKMEVGR